MGVTGFQTCALPIGMRRIALVEGSYPCRRNGIEEQAGVREPPSPPARPAGPSTQSDYAAVARWNKSRSRARLAGAVHVQRQHALSGVEFRGQLDPPTERLLTADRRGGHYKMS